MPVLAQTPRQPELPSCENILEVCCFLVANKVSLCGGAVWHPTESLGWREEIQQNSLHEGTCASNTWTTSAAFTDIKINASSIKVNAFCELQDWASSVPVPPTGLNCASHQEYRLEPRLKPATSKPSAFKGFLLQLSSGSYVSRQLLKSCFHPHLPICYPNPFPPPQDRCYQNKPWYDVWISPQTRTFCRGKMLSCV